MKQAQRGQGGRELQVSRQRAPQAVVRQIQGPQLACLGQPALLLPNSLVQLVADQQQGVQVRGWAPGRADGCEGIAIEQQILQAIGEGGGQWAAHARAR